MAQRELPAVFCIIVSWTRFIGMAMRTYEICTNPKGTHCKEVSGKEARAIIQKYGLVKAYEAPDLGIIYDSPERAFLQKYKGFFADQARKGKYYY